MSTLVLDVDESLLKCIEEPKFIEKFKIYGDNFEKFHPFGESPFFYSFCLQYKGEMENYCAILRPYYKEFLELASKKFTNLILFSAGSDDYIRAVSKLLFSHGEIPHNVRIIQTRPNCSIDKDKNYHKPLKKLAKFCKDNFPDLKVCPKKILIVDDKLYTTQENPEYGILIPEFSPKDSSINSLLDRSDIRLYQLTEWLKKVDLNVDDFAKINKEKIFT